MWSAEKVRTGPDRVSCDMKIRIDQLLVDRGLAESKTKAQALILAGQVLVGTQRVDKAGQPVPSDAEVAIKGPVHPWVSRGGIKLDHALSTFAIDVKNAITLDVGASTGGFTDVLLSRGAARIYAVDVGHGQLDWKLRNDARVVVCEKTNARYLTREQVPEAINLVVCDASFISLKTVLPAALSLAAPGPPPALAGEANRCAADAVAQLIALIKPQFEVGKSQIGKGGVVRDATLHQAVCEDITRWLEDAMGWRVQAITDSPISGPKGNREFLLWAVRSACAGERI